MTTSKAFFRKPNDYVYIVENTYTGQNSRG